MVLIWGNLTGLRFGLPCCEASTVPLVLLEQTNCASLPVPVAGVATVGAAVYL